MARVDTYEPEDLAFIWGGDDEVTDMLREPSSRPTLPRTRPRAAKVAIAVTASALLFAAGSCAGSIHGTRVAREAVAEAAYASVTAEKAADAAKSLRAEADALRSDLASATAAAERWQKQAEDASATAPAPQTSSAPVTASGWATAKASWYSEGYGERLASGALYNPESVFVAHKTLPFVTLVRIRFNGREVTAPVLDRGPYIDGRMFDLSAGAATVLGFDGVQSVEWRVES